MTRKTDQLKIRKKKVLYFLEMPFFIFVEFVCLPVISSQVIKKLNVACLHAQLVRCAVKLQQMFLQQDEWKAETSTQDELTRGGRKGEAEVRELHEWKVHQSILCLSFRCNSSTIMALKLSVKFLSVKQTNKQTKILLILSEKKYFLH